MTMPTMTMLGLNGAGSVYMPQDIDVISHEQNFVADGVKTNFYIPVGNWVATVPGISLCEISGNGRDYVQIALGPDYQYKYRDFQGHPPLTVSDLWIGITTSKVYQAGTHIRLRWQERRLTRTPPLLLGAYFIENPSGSGLYTVGMNGYRWSPNRAVTAPDQAVAPNGIVATAIDDPNFQLELWRWRKKQGGRTTINQPAQPRPAWGPRYLPYFRGPSPSTTDKWQIVISPGTPAPLPTQGNRYTMRQFVACYVHLPSGARSAFSNRVTVAGSNPVRMGNPPGFINRGNLVFSQE